MLMAEYVLHFEQPSGRSICRASYVGTSLAHAAVGVQRLFEHAGLTADARDKPVGVLVWFHAPRTPHLVTCIM